MSRPVDARALVEQYVRELERALRDLGDTRPAEAVTEIRAHLEEGIGQTNDPDVALRLMIDLGRPEDVASSLVANRAGGLVPAPRPLTTAARVLDAIIALTPLTVLLLAPVYSLVSTLELRALTGAAELGAGIGSAETLILGVPALLGILWAAMYLRRSRRPGGSIAHEALGLEAVVREGRVQVVQAPTPAGRAARQRRGRLVRLLLTVTVFVVAITAMSVRILSYSPDDLAMRMGFVPQGETRMAEAETRTLAVLDDYYDALRRRHTEAAVTYLQSSAGRSFDELYPAELLADFAYEEIVLWEMRSQEGIEADANPLVVPYTVEVAEYFGDPAHPDRRRVVTYSLEYTSEWTDYSFEEAEVRWVSVSAGQLEKLQ